MSDFMADQLYEILRYVRPLHQWSAKSVGNAIAERGMTMTMRAVMEQLYESGPQTVPQLARSLWLARQGVQRVVDDAVAQGLLSLTENPAHRRSRLVELTAEGGKAFEDLHCDEFEVLSGFTETLDPSDVDAAVRVVAALTDEVRKVAHEGTSDQQRLVQSHQQDGNV